MIPKITVYTWPQPSAEDQQLIRMFQNNGFTPMIDAIHKTDTQWFNQQYKSNYRFFALKAQCLDAFDVHSLNPALNKTPAFTISYNGIDFISEHDWRFITRYFDHLFFPLCNKPKIISRRAHELLNTPIRISPNIAPEPIQTTTSDSYDLELKEIPDRNVCLCTVTKPNVDRPYTVVIRNYASTGLVPFFTSLFISKSWGVAGADYAFLKSVWQQYMQGDFDLDGMLKQATEACYPSSQSPPIPEPEVYRKSMVDTLATLQAKEEGLLFKATC